VAEILRRGNPVLAQPLRGGPRLLVRLAVYLAFFSTFKADWKDLLAFTNIPDTIRQIKFYLLIDKEEPPQTGLYGPCSR